MGSEFPYGKGTIEGDIVGHATGRYTRAFHEGAAVMRQLVLVAERCR